MFDKLALASEEEILNATETSLKNEKEHEKKKKNSCLIHSISLVVVSFVLLIFISINYYYFHTKQKHLLPFNFSNNKLR